VGNGASEMHQLTMLPKISEAAMRKEILVTLPNNEL
jgi:hypothetical protein